MATGSGKLALFMAPIFWLEPSSVVIVVVPFIALMQDLVEQCCAKGIVTRKWMGYNCADKMDGSQLVFVAAENCYGTTFCSWAQELAHSKWLAAIFFDECHVCLTQCDFQPAMEKIKALMTAVQVLQYFLTATLPPSLVNSLKAKLNPPEDGTGMIWAATNQSNISYSVQCFVDMKDLCNNIPQLVATHRYGAIMVICHSKALAQALADELGCKCIWLEMPDADKQALLSVWIWCSATEQQDGVCILVGTSAIGTGINPQHVSLVVHTGEAWDMISYVQESGWAEHGNSTASAILMMVPRETGNTHVKQYAEEKNCQWLFISGYMDGMPITCLSQPDYALCDLCQQRAGGISTPCKKVVELDSPPQSDKVEHSCNGGHKVPALLPMSPTRKGSQHQDFVTALDLFNIQQQDNNQSKPQFGKQGQQKTLALHPTNNYTVTGRTQA